MSDSELAPEVLRFIEQHIDTVPQLEALLLVWESRPQRWSEMDMARRLYVDGAAAKRVLNDLERRKLIASEAGPDGARMYLASENSPPIVDAVVRTYRRNLVSVARFIHSKGTPAMREFAKAFQFKDK